MSKTELDHFKEAMAKMARYDIENDTVMNLHPTGDYVLFDDVRKALAWAERAQLADEFNGITEAR